MSTIPISKEITFYGIDPRVLKLGTNFFCMLRTAVTALQKNHGMTTRHNLTGHKQAQGYRLMITSRTIYI